MTKRTHCANCGGEVPADKPHQVGDCSGPATTTLASFLLARIADDETVARAATPSPWRVDRSGYALRGNDGRNWVGETVASQEPIGDAEHIARNDPARVLAECAAKRAIVEAHQAWDEDPEPRSPDYWLAPMDRVVEHLAAVYADHPEYDEAWRP